MYRGPFTTPDVEVVLGILIADGSEAAPGFMDPEGIVIFHAASGQLFKRTIKGDEAPKGITVPAASRETIQAVLASI